MAVPFTAQEQKSGRRAYPTNTAPPIHRGGITPRDALSSNLELMLKSPLISPYVATRPQPSHDPQTTLRRFQTMAGVPSTRLDSSGQVAIPGSCTRHESTRRPHARTTSMTRMWLPDNDDVPFESADVARARGCEGSPLGRWRRAGRGALRGTRRGELPRRTADMPPGPAARRICQRHARRAKSRDDCPAEIRTRGPQHGWMGLCGRRAWVGSPSEGRSRWRAWCRAGLADCRSGRPACSRRA